MTAEIRVDYIVIIWLVEMTAEMTAGSIELKDDQKYIIILLFPSLFTHLCHLLFTVAIHEL